MYMEKEMAIHATILACKIPWSEEPGGLQSMGCRVGHNWATNTCTFSSGSVLEFTICIYAWASTLRTFCSILLVFSYSLSIYVLSLITHCYRFILSYSFTSSIAFCTFLHLQALIWDHFPSTGRTFFSISFNAGLLVM